MNGWWLALAAWIGLSVPAALVVGRMIRTADRLTREPREVRGPSARETHTHLPLEPDHRDSA
jgi:hypothetical protein